jgi:energy-coupling factor transporter ATP-binding protein EcfA2
MSRTTLKLKLENYKAIRDATIALDDITVLSGVNASGKSTIAHAFHSIINLSATYNEWAIRSAWSDIAPLVWEMASLAGRLSQGNGYEGGALNNAIVDDFERNLLLRPYSDTVKAVSNVLSNIGELIAARKNDESATRAFDVFLRNISKDSEVTVENYIANVTRKLSRSQEKYDDLIRQRVYTAYNVVSPAMREWLMFPGVICFSESDTVVYHTEKGQQGNAQPISDLKEIYGVKRAIYIESPWTSIPRLQNDGRLDMKDGYVYPVGKLRNQPKLGLFEVLNGSLKNEDGHWQYLRKDGLSPIDLSICATGMKALSILEILYDGGYLDDDTLLIVDEPEAHLHPQWVFEYAKILVALNRRHQVRLLITSHNPDMVNAIKTIADEEGVEGLRFYVSESVDDSPYDFTYRDLGRDIEPIFATFNKALDSIEAYRGRD